MDIVKYQYPVLFKFVNRILPLLLSAFIFVFALFLFIVRISNQDILEAGEMNAALAGLFGALLVSVLAIIVHLSFPDLWVQNGSFQIRTECYKSRWLKWEDIRAIEEHQLSSERHRLHNVLVDQISPIYTFLGIVQKMNGRGFVLSDRIRNYQELLQILRTNRPDLFNN